MSAWEEMLQRIELGDCHGVAVLANRLDDAGRKEVAAALPGYVRSTGLRRWGDRRAHALRVAGAGCISGVAAAASWIMRRELRDGRHPQLARHLVAAVAHRPDAWRLDLARRLAEKLRLADFTAWRADLASWEVAALLHIEAREKPPTSGAFVVGWLGWRTYVPPKEDPFFTTLVPAIFEADGVGEHLGGNDALALARQWDRSGARPRPLVEDLLVFADRRDLLDGCVRRFLRGGTARSLGWFVRLHALLAPDAAEATERLRDYVRLLPTAVTAVAEEAFTAIRAADEAARLDPGVFRETAETLLFRPEAKLVRAALAWLDKTAKGRESATVEALAGVFGHENAALRERAVRIAVKRAKAVDPLTAESVRRAAAGLPAPQRAEIAAAYGEVKAAEPVAAPVLYPVAPRELEPPIASAAELREALVPHLTTFAEAWPETERLLAGLVAHGPEIADGLRDFVGEYRPFLYRADLGPHLRGVDITLNCMLLGRSGDALTNYAARLLRGAEERLGPVPAPEDLFRRRFVEAALHVGGPALLATPTEASGHVDPGVFAARLRAHEAAGRAPGRADLEQALLRLPPGTEASVLDGFVSPAADTARAWLAGDASVPPAFTYRTAQLPKKGSPSGTTPRLAVGVSWDVSLASAALLGTLAEPEDAEAHWTGSAAWWPSALPSHREVAAAYLLVLAPLWPGIRIDQDTTILALADAKGPTGPATAAVLLYALSSERPTDRAAALDALLALAATDTLPAADMGRLMATLAPDLVLSRIIAALPDAVRAGARLWPLFAESITAFLPTPDARPPAPFADLLAAASTYADLHRVHTPLPALTAWTPRSRTTRTAKEATRLTKTLTPP
ncbi:DUF6493 family protein [Actinocorallia sp. A-T 12471]|uniref:DUF6493 family protein n=1 Tax=Actinocorallia sp. A-T 12471 TaxID=3089813 RepID=UPI0029D01390|nr:DUF6493 family protein [Actinocorallia sp. A-T 12471]MDX6740918.1 DUF6493 family protein [Actinocorallia sp. A-T 12471]